MCQTVATKLNLSLLLKTWNLTFNILIRIQKNIKNIINAKKTGMKKNQTSSYCFYSISFAGWTLVLITTALVFGIPQQLHRAQLKKQVDDGFFTRDEEMFPLRNF